MFDEPQSELVRLARATAKEHLSAALYAHSARVFHLGKAAGIAIKARFDEELLYVAAILHDLGLAYPPEESRSFEIVGAQIARGLMEAHDANRAARVWDAIAVHTVPHLAHAGAAESLLLHIASASDAFGARLPLAADVAPALEAQFPRGDLGRELEALTDVHAQTQPYGQLAALRALGLRPRT